jgi:hypothetical protein
MAKNNHSFHIRRSRHFDLVHSVSGMLYFTTAVRCSSKVLPYIDIRLNDPRWHSRNDRPPGYVRDYHSIGANDTLITDINVPDDFRARSDVNPVTNSWWIHISSTPANGDLLSYDAILADASPLVYHHPHSAVAETGATTDLRLVRDGRVVDEKHKPVNQLRQYGDASQIEPACKAVRLASIHTAWPVAVGV